MCVCVRVLVHLQLAQKVIDFWGCSIRKQWKWNGIFGQNELKWWSTMYIRHCTAQAYHIFQLLCQCTTHTICFYTASTYKRRQTHSAVNKLNKTSFEMRNHENEWEIICHVECFGIRWDDDALNYALCRVVYLFVPLYHCVCVCRCVRGRLYLRVINVLFMCTCVCVYTVSIVVGTTLSASADE